MGHWMFFKQAQPFLNRYSLVGALITKHQNKEHQNKEHFQGTFEATSPVDSTLLPFPSFLHKRWTAIKLLPFEQGCDPASLNIKIWCLPKLSCALQPSIPYMSTGTHS